MTEDIEMLKSEIRRLRKALSHFSPSLKLMLKRRGFIIYKKEPTEDLILPDKRYASDYYENLKKYSFRLFLRDVIKHQESFTLENVTKYATKEVSAQYLDFLLQTGIAEKHDAQYRITAGPIKSFGATLEWFVAELIKNDFEADTTWGVKFRRPNVGGDYDLLAKIDASLLYMEIKSSPPKQLYDSEITSFFDRLEDLAPNISIFFSDTELRMKDKIVPMFEEELRNRYTNPPPVHRLVKELFHINSKIFIINAKGSITANITRVLNFFWHNKFQII